MKLLPFALLLLPAIAAADPASTAPTPAPAPAVVQAQAPVSSPSPEGKDSINVSILGAIFGDYGLTYEHLFNGTNGLIVELGGGHDSGSDASDTHGSVGVGYRWHWQHKQNSGFLGVTLASAYGDGDATIDDGSGADPMTYDMRISSLSLTGNIGKRWMIGKHVNITLRGGLGWAHYTATAKDSTPDAKKAEASMNKLLTLIPIGVDGELSLGYVF